MEESKQDDHISLRSQGRDEALAQKRVGHPSKGTMKSKAKGPNEDPLQSSKGTLGRDEVPSRKSQRFTDQVQGTPRNEDKESEINKSLNV